VIESGGMDLHASGPSEAGIHARFAGSLVIGPPTRDGSGSAIGQRIAAAKHGVHGGRGPLPVDARCGFCAKALRLRGPCRFAGE